MRKVPGLILTIVVIGAVVACAGYYYLKHKTETETNNDQTSEINISSTALDPTAGWKTYSDSTYGLTFKYPADWTAPTYESVKANDSGMISVNYDYLDFKGSSTKYLIKSVEISKTTDYPTTLQSKVNALLSVYNNKNLATASKLWLPGGNASIIAASAPTYLETSDGTFRGIYYFANIGQDYSTNLDCLVLITDGTNIIQFHIAMNSDNAVQYQNSTGQNSEFNTYVQSLDLNSSETIVKEFKDIFKLMAQSLQQV